MNVDNIVGALYSPMDGHVDPNGLCMGLTRAAKKAGARVIEGCTVEDIVTEERSFGAWGVTEVKTDLGSIKTNCVVNCTGAWANYISHMVRHMLTCAFVDA